jgi:hypothetical protein
MMEFFKCRGWKNPATRGLCAARNDHPEKPPPEVENRAAGLALAQRYIGRVVGYAIEMVTIMDLTTGYHSQRRGGPFVAEETYSQHGSHRGRGGDLARGEKRTICTIALEGGFQKGDTTPRIHGNQ